MDPGGLVRCEDPLRAEVERLRTELCMREAEYDELMCQRRPAVMAEYMLAIGHLELRLYRLRCDCARLARRIDMLRAALNRGDTPDTEAIDAALDAEFAEFEKTVSQMIGELNDALARRDMEALTPEEVREIREVYYRIVKRLHPDVNPGSGPEMLEMYTRAVEMYRRGDLVGLRIIEAALADPSSLPDSSQLLEAERDRLRGLLEKLSARIREVEASHPFDKAPLLRDPELLERRRAELEEAIAGMEEQREMLKMEMEGLGWNSLQ